jgi:predicted nuclease of predicted toxin-antitoxin system
MATFYADENFPHPVVEELRKLGHDVLTMTEAGKANQQISDDEVLKLASEAKRILLTFNRKHFIRIHMDNPDHAGVIVCTVDADFAALAQRIHGALQDYPETTGQLIRVNRPNL